ncbi:unnamed protein product [Auanema sp. JU1783]|nr:unnamed protein product [Auanema sp. JU1783]
MSTEWQKFFVHAGIPAAVARSYANSFKQNRIDKTMLKDLDKSTLAELGVTAIGDQLAILRRAKNLGDLSVADDSSKVVASQRSRVSAPGEHFPAASSLRKGRPPPDRNEIYHIKMPDGNTSRTKKILAKHEQLRRQGLAIRGTTGVRQAGRDVSPVDKTSVAARTSKGGILDRLGGVRVVERSKKVLGGRVDKRGSPQTKFSGANMRVRVASSNDGAIIVKRNNNRVAPSSVTVSVNGNPNRFRRSNMGSRLQVAGGSFNNKRNIKSRIVYEDDNVMEYADDGLIYEDDEEGLYDYEDGDYVQYVQKPSIYDRLSK